MDTEADCRENRPHSGVGFQLRNGQAASQRRHDPALRRSPRSLHELLRGSKSTGTAKKQPNIKLLRRMEQIEALPLYEQRALLTTIDKFLAAAQDR